MRITAKGRYALAAMIYIGLQEEHECVPVIQISEALGISKIYLEQVFSLLKRNKIVSSVKGSQGGYELTKKASEISVYEIVASTEAAIIETTKGTVEKEAPGINHSMMSKVFMPLDRTIVDYLSSIYLEELVIEAKSFENPDGYMFFI